MTDNKPKGGRGLKAQHPTRTVRVPEALVNRVNQMSEDYRAGEGDTLDLILDLVQRYSNEQKDTRDWTKYKQFIEELDGYLPKSIDDRES